MAEGITLKRIIDMDEATELTSSDYALVDSATGGPKKFALGDELSSLKEDIENYIAIESANNLFSESGYYSYISGDFIENATYKSTKKLDVGMLAGKVVRFITSTSSSVYPCIILNDSGVVHYYAGDNNYQNYDIDKIVGDYPSTKYIVFTAEAAVFPLHYPMYVIDKKTAKEDEYLQNQLDNFKNYVDYNPRFLNGFAAHTALVNIGEVFPDKITTSNTYKSQTIECRGGDKFVLKGIGDSSSFRLWCFLDSNRVELSRAAGTSAANDASLPITITAPSNAKYLIVNMRMDFAGSYVRKYRQYLTNTNEYKYVFPEWAQVHPFKNYEGQYTYTNGMNTSSAGFSFWNDLFHSVVVDNSSSGIEEINIGNAYNTAESETTPSYISSFGGGINMYHIPTPPMDGGGFAVKHKPLKVMLVGGIHGSERKSIWDLYLLLKQVAESTFVNTGDETPERAIINIRNFVDLYVIPIANPSGVNNCTRNNANTSVKANGINLNRDFDVDGWIATSDSDSVPNSQWETRVVEYALDTYAPDIVIDHHTSSGDNTYSAENPTGEHGKFIEWGDSDIPEVASIIEENLMEITPYVKLAFPEKLGSYNFVFGHTDDITSTSVHYGMLPRHALQHNNAISLTYEVVQHLRFTPPGTDRIFGFSDEDEIALASINYFGFVNMLMKIIDISKEWLNNKSFY